MSVVFGFIILAIIAALVKKKTGLTLTKFFEQKIQNYHKKNEDKENH